MTTTIIRKTSFSRLLSAISKLITAFWLRLGDNLQKSHRKRKNAKAYRLLMEQDEHLLKDIGISKPQISRICNQACGHNAQQQYEKIRATSGRHVL